MKLKSIKLKIFRGYPEMIAVDFDNLTALIGKNDIGKSTILEALDIFFNKSRAINKLAKEDVNVYCRSIEDVTTEITITFTDVPTEIILDTTFKTSVVSEYLLNSDQELEVIKRYFNGGGEKVFIRANHPTNEFCSDLLGKTQSQLQRIIYDKNVACSNRVANSIMRSAIWHHYSDELQLREVEIDVTKGDAKSIWENLENYLPIYSLFQADRKNSDGDSEVQDPLNEAVKQILAEADIQKTLFEVAKIVEEKLKEVAGLTLGKLKEINPNLADSLNPSIPTSDTLKWNEVFKKVALSGDQDIFINKRGSGVKRLVLMSFFLAEVERSCKSRSVQNVIYAIEEPETSQHSAHQKILMESLIKLSKSQNTQIIVTTHSPLIVKQLDYLNLRLIRLIDGQKTVQSVVQGQLPFTSLNEVNFTSFEEVSEEYHNELYGFLFSENRMKEFRQGRERMPYIRQFNYGSSVVLEVTLTDYVRHQIHHPENVMNVRFSLDQLKLSIELMREFIAKQELSHISKVKS